MTRIIFCLMLLNSFALQACLLKELKKKKVNDTSFQSPIVPLSSKFNEAQEQIAPRILLHDPLLVRDIGEYPRVANLLYSLPYSGKAQVLYKDQCVTVEGKTLSEIAEKCKNIPARNAMVFAYFKDEINEVCAEN